MMLLSGYTLGFFFPKQEAHLPAKALAHGTGEGTLAREAAPEETASPPPPERTEVPAAFYFYRYF